VSNDDGEAATGGPHHATQGGGFSDQAEDETTTHPIPSRRLSDRSRRPVWEPEPPSCPWAWQQLWRLVRNGSSDSNHETAERRWRGVRKGRNTSRATACKRNMQTGRHASNSDACLRAREWYADGIGLLSEGAREWGTRSKVFAVQLPCWL